MGFCRLPHMCDGVHPPLVQSTRVIITKLSSVLSLYTMYFVCCQFFCGGGTKSITFLQRSFTKSAKLNWSHLLGFWPIIRAPFTQWTTCFCSYVVIHTCVWDTFIISIMKMGNPKLLCDSVKKEGENIKSNPSLWKGKMSSNPKWLCDLEKKEGVNITQILHF